MRRFRKIVHKPQLVVSGPAKSGWIASGQADVRGWRSASTRTAGRMADAAARTASGPPVGPRGRDGDPVLGQRRTMIAVEGGVGLPQPRPRPCIRSSALPCRQARWAARLSPISPGRSQRLVVGLSERIRQGDPAGARSGRWDRSPKGREVPWGGAALALGSGVARALRASGSRRERDGHYAAPVLVNGGRRRVAVATVIATGFRPTMQRGDPAPDRARQPCACRCPDGAARPVGKGARAADRASRSDKPGRVGRPGGRDHPRSSASIVVNAARC